jgi:hypothetical protein
MRFSGKSGKFVSGAGNRGNKLDHTVPLLTLGTLARPLIQLGATLFTNKVDFGFCLGF